MFVVIEKVEVVGLLFVLGLSVVSLMLMFSIVRSIWMIRVMMMFVKIVFYEILLIMMVWVFLEIFGCVEIVLFDSGGLLEE